MQGGCLCGSVRYALASPPFDAGWCHCRTCQLSSGSPSMAFATVPTGDLRFERGADLVGTVKSTDFGRREFCSRCGTPLTIRVDFQPDTVDFTIATLDDPTAIEPGFHIFYASRIPWAKSGDALPRHDRFRAETRGLEQGESPV
jgi:hypothetical protein